MHTSTTRTTRLVMAIAAVCLAVLAPLAPASAHAARTKPTATFVGCNYEGTDFATAVIVVRNVTKPVTWSATYYDADGMTHRVQGRIVDTARRVFRFRFDIAHEQLLQVKIKRGDTRLMNQMMDDMEHCGSTYSQP